MRQDHLTEQQMLAFKARGLGPSELLEFDAHLSSCSACRDRMWNNLNGDRKVASLRSQLLTDAEPLVHTRGSANPSWVTAGIWTAAAALLLTGITIGVVGLRKPPSSSTQLTNIQQEIPETMPAEYRAALDQAKQDGKLARAPVLNELIRRKSTLLAGGVAERSYFVFEPVGTVVLSDRPLLKWQAVPGAAHYVVSIFDTDYRKVAESPALAGTEWQPLAALPRGKTYSWQVSTVVKGETIRWPHPPAPEAVFRVLDAAKADELDRVRRAQSDSHLLLGVLYAKEGLLDDAEAELKLADPAEARPLLDDLSRIRRP